MDLDDFSLINSRVLIAIMAIVFLNLNPKCQNKTFLVPNLGIIIYSRNFATRQIRGQTSAQKYPNQEFLVTNLGIFYFCTKLWNYKNSRVVMSNMTILS